MQFPLNANFMQFSVSSAKVFQCASVGHILCSLFSFHRVGECVFVEKEHMVRCEKNGSGASNFMLEFALLNVCDGEFWPVKMPIMKKNPIFTH